MRFIALGVIIYYILATAAGDNLDVCLKDLGCLRGTLMPGYQKGEFEAFMGIPFAQPPVGSLRLKNPVPAAAWEGVLDAGSPKESCLQKNYFSSNWQVSGEEDCLYLNVYRPQQRDGNPLPVMFYIYGGGFFSGSAQPTVSGPDYLMDTEKVIMVTVAYRLGPFGYLSTGDEHMSGNFGFKDQRLALQWVQQHISSFGGDPDLVTIFGHSAGGISAHLHMISPNSKGLFHRAMSLAGTMHIPAVRIIEDPLAQTRQLAQVAGIDGAESLGTQDLAEALRDVDSMALLNSMDSLKVWDMQPLVTSRPVVEPDEGCPEAFLVEDPLKAHSAGRIHQVPWVLSMSSRAGEGSLVLFHAIADPKLQAEFNEDFATHLAQVLNLPDGTSPEVVKDILDAYDFHGNSLNNNTLIALTEISGDFNFYYPLYETLSSYVGQADLQRNPLFVYIFEFIGMHTLAPLFSGTDLDFGVGAVHMDDGLHTISIPAIGKEFPKDSEDAKVIQRMTSLMTEFAKTGIFHDEATCQAAAFEEQKMCNYLHFGGDSHGPLKETIQNRLDLAAFSIWRKLFL
ncbi:hypothetical protein KR009_000936 [Drosophila setifemur]|nr:hypothetical protein KR009_000936 [Drosophila setifemur]